MINQYYLGDNEGVHQCAKHYIGGIFMIQYRKILEMAQEGLSLRTVSASTGHGRLKVTEISVG